MKLDRDFALACQIMGEHFIGPDELRAIHDRIPIAEPYDLAGEMPGIPWSPAQLKRVRRNFILVLGMPIDGVGNMLTINRLREHFGLDPDHSEPCFYNQDWYVKERFASASTLELKWYLLGTTLLRRTRGIPPTQAQQQLADSQTLPSAVLVTYSFFAYFLLTGGKMLFKHEFVWCADKDKNGDQIYVGRYQDPNHINKNGFNVHRHLSIRYCHGVAPLISQA